MKLNDLIYIAGHEGLIGSAIVRVLQLSGYNNLLLRKHEHLDSIRAYKENKNAIPQPFLDLIF